MAHFACYVNLAMCLLLACAIHSTRAKEYTVGDSSGWDLGVDYATWASQYTFKMGDSLKFSYSDGVHSVQQVSDEDYKACNAANAIFSGTSGSSVVKLGKAGTYNFICGVAVHCQGGMKLSVKVSDKAAAPTNSASAPTPIGTPTKHASPSSPTADSTSAAPTTSTPPPPSTPSSPSSPSKSSPLPSFLIISLLYIVFSTSLLTFHT